MKLNKRPYKTCTNIYCKDCRELVACKVSEGTCENCGKELGNISEEMEAVISLYSDITEKIMKIRLNEARVLLIEDYQNEEQEQMSKQFTNLIKELKIIDNSLGFQSWKDNRGFNYKDSLI